MSHLDLSLYIKPYTIYEAYAYAYALTYTYTGLGGQKHDSKHIGFAIASSHMSNVSQCISRVAAVDCCSL